MVEACGPVRIAEGGEHHVGAIRATNGTAEMQALIGALFWLNSCVEQDNLPTFSNVMMSVDSLYVKGLIDEKIVAMETQNAGNTALSHVESGSEKSGNFTCDGYGDTLVTWEILLLVSWQTRERVWKHSIVVEVNGRKTFSKQRC